MYMSDVPTRTHKTLVRPVYLQFGKIERDATGRLVASTNNFDHTKYVNTVDEGKQHIEAIFALEGLK